MHAFVIYTYNINAFWLASQFPKDRAKAQLSESQGSEDSSRASNILTFNISIHP